jgi:hypothetical protein
MKQTAAPRYQAHVYKARPQTLEVLPGISLRVNDNLQGGVSLYQVDEHFDIAAGSFGIGAGAMPEFNEFKSQLLI